MIDNIMIFAAGKGSRMLNLSANQPKPTIKILDKQLLHYALELALTYPFKKIVINTHYLPEQIKDSIEQFQNKHPDIKSEIIISHEPELLETGGGIKNAQSFLGNKPIFTMNADAIIKSNVNLFHYMIAKWQEVRADFLLLLQPTKKAVGYTKNGDFNIQPDGKLNKPNIADGETYEYMYSGMQILNPKIIYQEMNKIFSLTKYFHSKDYQVYGVPAPSDCKWYHANTPADIINIEKNMRKIC